MTISMQTPRVRIKNVCTSPEAGALLPAYIADQLGDAQAETIEVHLNDCPHCKEHYLTMLEARSEAPERLPEIMDANEDEPTVPPAPVDPVEMSPRDIRRKGKASSS